MKTKTITIMLAVVVLSFGAGCKKNEGTTTTNPGVSGSSSKACDLKISMRKLWEDHITWTRNVIFNLVDALPGKDQDLGRLMKNQEDIGNAIQGYYGDDSGRKLTALLKTHISESAVVVQAAMNNDQPALDEANRKWTANADSIADFLHNANSNWTLEDLKTMMHDHLKFTTDEAMARIHKDYAADVDAYDKVHDEILRMADMLSDGIVKQFPEKF